MKRFISLLITALLFVSTPIYSATNFPSSLDVFTDQTASDLITSAKWNNMQDAIEAAQAKIGADSSAVTTSHDYLINTTLTNALPPVGSIIAYSPGYFTNGSNAGFTYQMVSANTVAAVNTLLNPKGYYVCNGAALNDSASGIFNGANRYLPNLTDDRFLMGDTAAGTAAGANSYDLSHTHTTGDFALQTTHLAAHNHTITVNSDGSHTHSTYICSLAGGGDWHPGLASGDTGAQATSSGGSHTHTASSANTGSGTAHNHGTTGSGGSATQEIRPSYLSVFYIMRVH
jgi:hypothetical protein